jgi:signal peptidase I
VIDPIKIARHQGEYQLKSYNRWYVYVLYYITIIVMLMLASENGIFGYKYKIASKSMLPTLENGDLILSDNDSSDLKFGDVVIFKYPNFEKTQHMSMLHMLSVLLLYLATITTN